MDVASSARIQDGGLPRLRFSRLVWLVLLSQVLSLAVVSTALWDLQKGLSQITARVGQAAYQSFPDTLTGSSADDPNRQRSTLKPPKVRIIGETTQILECITNALQASRQEANGDTADEPDSNCGLLDGDEQRGKVDGPPGEK